MANKALGPRVESANVLLPRGGTNKFLSKYYLYAYKLGLSLTLVRETSFRSG